jgi:hypothetical protein
VKKKGENYLSKRFVMFDENLLKTIPNQNQEENIQEEENQKLKKNTN